MICGLRNPRVVGVRSIRIDRTVRVACETGAATVGEDHRTAAANVDWSSTAAIVSTINTVTIVHIVGHNIFTEAKIKMVLYLLYGTCVIWLRAKPITVPLFPPNMSL